jgi:hypothetical protein
LTKDVIVLFKIKHEVAEEKSISPVIMLFEITDEQYCPSIEPTIELLVISGEATLIVTLMFLRTAF